MVIANAGMALYCVNRAAGMNEAVSRAKESLESGKALKTFKRLIDGKK